VTIKRLQVSLGQVFTAFVALPAAADLRAKVGTDTSLPWPQG